MTWNRPSSCGTRSWNWYDDESGAPLSPLPVRREDVILVRHSRVAREPATDRTRLVGNERVARTVVIEHGIGPALRARIFLAVLLDQEDILQHVRDTHREGRLGALFRLPLNLGDLGAVRKRFSVVRNAGLVSG